MPNAPAKPPLDDRTGVVALAKEWANQNPTRSIEQVYLTILARAVLEMDERLRELGQ